VVGQESVQGSVMIRFIHAVKPTVCAVVGSRQSTGWSLDRGPSGAWTGD
jgi:hypothetical protein